MIRPDYDNSHSRRPWALGQLLVFGLLAGLAFYLLVTGRFAPFRGDSEMAGATNPTNAPLISIEQRRTPVPMPLPSPTAPVAPLFGLTDLSDDNLTRHLADYAGQPVILNFWASWCLPCRQEMPALQQAYSQYNEAGLVVLGVNQTWQDNLSEARAFVAELNLTFPNVRDDTGVTSNELYQIVGLPTSVFITAEGRIAHVQIGQMTEEQIGTFTSWLIAGEALRP